MNESAIIKIMKGSDIDIVASLPCDRNKLFTRMLPEHFKTVDITREEDGVGICAGAYLAGRRPIMSIQSSGLGNMMNAIMSLTAVYRMPLPIIASWRGTESENIEAQIPFNSRIPEMLDAFNISYAAVECSEDIPKIKDMIDLAFDNDEITVILIKPELWTETSAAEGYGERGRTSRLRYDKTISEPKLYRLDAIKAIMDSIDDDAIVVSNIGVPSKETYAARDRPLNFYMMGSYTQATPIGLGIALSVKRKVIVLDGDGSLLGSSVLPVVASEHPENLCIVCLDNGTFGSTGNQMTNAYRDVDMELVAKAYGIKHTEKASDLCGIVEAVRKRQSGTRFIHVPIRPGNSKSPNIPLKAIEIRRRFMDAICH